MAYKSRAQLRHERKTRQGYALIAGLSIILSAMFYAAYSIDQARGISVSQSLKTWGL